MFAILKREFRSYFRNMTGYVFIALLLCFCGIFSSLINLHGQSAMFEYSLSSASLILLIIIPVLAMRSLSEDKHNRTDQLLYSLPIKMSQIVIAKYIALLAIYALSIVVLAIYPFILSAFGIIDYASCFAALLGFFILGAALLAICMFISSLTESQVIAAVISFAVLLTMFLMSSIASLIPSTSIASYIGMIFILAIVTLILYLLTKNTLLSIAVACAGILPLSIAYFVNKSLFEGFLPNAISNLAVFDRFYNFTYGIFDLNAIIYYLSIIIFFVFLTVQSVDKKRWS